MAYTPEFLYQVRKHDGESDWQVSVWFLRRTEANGDAPPMLVPGDEVARVRVVSKSWGYAVCQAYEALGNGYNGVTSRIARAVTMAGDGFTPTE